MFGNNVDEAGTDEGNTYDLAEPVRAPADSGVSSSPTHAEKCCVRCGCDLTGKPRLKDKKGYWCKDCSDAEHRERIKNRSVKCEECERTVPGYTIVKVQGRKLCDLCAEGLEPDPADPSDSAEQVAQKLCDSCGKDVSSQKRLWNGKGYLCVDCDAAERKKASEHKPRGKVPKLRCLECGRKVPADTLVKVAGLEVCLRCAESRALHGAPAGAEPQEPGESQIEVRPQTDDDDDRPGRSSREARSRWAEQDLEDTRNRRRKILAVVIVIIIGLIVSLYMNGLLKI